MPIPIIKISHISKKYTINQKQQYYSFRDKIANFFHEKLIYKKNSASDQEFWALNDISFNIYPGEVIGIIGRNGAGKSTLLKILSRITSPTTGEIRLRGRVNSLLEVGTGFHQELTGRENIYLNGAILGMRRNEIKKKFTEIVKFAEIEQFLDTPVKHYSSGMYMRLAFAIAAHLEPEIIVVDEVLAVGDTQFQKKCLGKMSEISKQGRTVIFVSHNMGAIQNLCSKCVLLEKGEMKFFGDTNKAIDLYLYSGGKTMAEKIWSNASKAPGDDVIRLHSVRICQKSGKTTENVDITKPIFIEVLYWNLKPGSQRVTGLHFFNDNGILLFVSYDLHNSTWRHKNLPIGLIKSTCQIPANLLAEGKIFVNVAVNTNNGIPICHAVEREAVAFKVYDPHNGKSVRGDISSQWDGLVRPLLNWNNRLVKESQP
jgi:lipopolysaccharide transport system ATP-binding protein